MDTDYYGSDLQALFDTDLASCQKACSAQKSCTGFVFNARSNACFPKQSMQTASEFLGAISALKQAQPAALIAQAEARAQRLDFLREADLAQAYSSAEKISRSFPAESAALEDMVEAAQIQARAGNDKGALRWLAQAVALSDEAGLWAEYSAILQRHSGVLSNGKQAARKRALAAGINAYLRAPSEAVQVNGLVAMARSLESLGRGRDMVPTLRLSEDIAPRRDTAHMLERAIERYGFRVVDSEVQSDRADPRLCIEFSETLQLSGVSYEDYVKISVPGIVATAEGSQLCVDGLEHGQRYSMTLRRGLPSGKGELLQRDVELTHYIGDRSPAVRFPGRAYVLAKTDQAALPIETVNLTEVSLRLRRVSDRNLLRSIQDGYFGRPLSQWQEEHFASDIAEEVWSGTAALQNTLNQDITTRLPLAEAIADQPVGIYALSATYDGANPYDEPGATQWFVLTDLGLSTMSGSDGLHVQVQGLSDAKPRAGVEVTLVSNANAILGKAVSDATGYAHFAPGLARGRGGAEAAMILAEVPGVEDAEAAEDFAFLSLKDAAFDLSDRGVEGRPSPGPVDVFLATDRGAYRAGEVIHVTALTRDSKAQAIDGLPLTAILSRPDGVEYSRRLSTGGAAGGHVFALPVGSTAPRGTWRLDLKSDVKAPALASRQILVEDFMPERIDFDQSVANAGALRPGEFAQLDISARYLFGAPGADLGIDGDLRLRPVQTLDKWPGYQFGRYDAPRDSQRNYFGGDVTDASGAARVTVELPVVDVTGMPFEATLSTRLTDGSGRPVERVMDLPVSPAGPVLGIKPLFDEEVAEGTEAQFELVALSEQLNQMPMRVKWSLNRIETRYHWYQLYGNWNWERSTRRKSIATGEAQLGESPVLVSAPTDWGRYELVVERLDGDYVEAAVDFYAGWYAPADGAATPDRLEMSLDAESYQPGDTARLRLVPRSSGTALISVLSNEVIERLAVEVTAGEVVVPLTVSEDWGSGAYVTAMMLQPLSGKASRTPTRALGLAHARVEQPGQELQVAIAVPEIARPRSTETAQITVSGAKPGEAVWLTVAAVDLGILNLTGFKSPDPSAYYHGQRRLGMELRDIYGRLIDPGNGVLGQIRSGGDADRGMQMQSPPPTQDLVAFFSGAVQVDASGKVDFPLELPAFNGTVRLMAVAWSDSAVGQAEADMLVRDPVVVTASLPRFLAPGDQSRMRIELVHADGPAGEMTLLAQTLGAGITLGTLPASVSLGEQGKAVLEMPLTATAVGDPEIVLSLITPEGKHLNQVLRMPVRANDPVVATTRRFSLQKGGSFQFTNDVFAGLQQGTTQAVLSAGPLAKFDVPGLLKTLDQYPYGCTEQVTSRALPLLYLSSVAQSLGLGRGPQVEARIQSAIQRVLTRQASNGAFGLWRAESGDFWLDAYASDFLSRARAQGHAVPEGAFVRAMDNLRNQLNYASDFDEGGEDVAYALLVLAREGAASMGDLRYYADVKAKAFATPLAAAQLGGALAAYGDQRRADRMFARAAELLEQTRSERPVWRVDYGTQRRDAAAVLALVVEAGSEAISTEQLSNRVTQSSEWMSTQESVWTLMAAHALIKNPEASGMLINGQPSEGSFVQIEGGQGPVNMSVTSANGAATDLTLTTLGVPEVPPAAGGYGYSLERRHYTLEGEEIDGRQFSVGDRFVTVLRVTPHETVGARLMVNDPLPAGIEIDNPNLLRSGDLSGLDWLKLTEAEHAEFRSDRFLAAVDLSGRKSATLAYISRAVTPGQFHHPAAQVEDMYRPAYRAHTDAGSVAIR
ncbi:MG2 domain-containing protein [Pseudophaeobacter sp.]|uniref:alpha-2-macroglobulin family protein n=1 Tax=Pseudophaeobacter sp. TaxID=1971739 RepID=UPI003298E462